MPVYTAAVISDAQIADIVAYLQSIPRGKPAAGHSVTQSLVDVPKKGSFGHARAM